MCAVHTSSPHQEKLSNAGAGRRTDTAAKADVIILGAGAASLLCAREAAGRGLRVLLLERAAVPGRKLAVSGGGKANFTNCAVRPQDYYCHHSQDFCGPALASFRPEDMLALTRAWNLSAEERAHGQLFLTVPAQRLVQALVRDCRERGCRLLATPPQAEAGGTLWHGKALVWLWAARPGRRPAAAAWLPAGSESGAYGHSAASGTCTSAPGSRRSRWRGPAGPCRH